MKFKNWYCHLSGLDRSHWSLDIGGLTGGESFAPAPEWRPLGHPSAWHRGEPPLPRAPEHAESNVGQCARHGDVMVISWFKHEKSDLIYILVIEPLKQSDLMWFQHQTWWNTAIQTSIIGILGLKQGILQIYHPNDNSSRKNDAKLSHFFGYHIFKPYVG